jgi:hypothetical protein
MAAVPQHHLSSAAIHSPIPSGSQKRLPPVSPANHSPIIFSNFNWLNWHTTRGGSTFYHKRATGTRKPKIFRKKA